MSKINSILSINYSILFSISLIGIVFLFILLQPKISSLMFTWKRQSVLQNFESAIKSQQKINPQEFWKFREFYSPGVFEVNKKGLTTSQLKNLNKIFNLKGSFLSVEKFKSGKIISLEALVQSNNLLDYAEKPNGEIILEKQNQVVFQNDNSLFIEFVMPISEMQKANGLFDYKEDDVDLLKGKYWLSVSKVNL